MLFKGQKVECVYDGKWANHTNRGPLPYVGITPVFRGVYTVSGFDVTDGLFLDEVPWTLTYADGSPVGWQSDCFRPLTEKSTETGMAVLRRIAATGKLPKKVKIKEDA